MKKSRFSEQQIALILKQPFVILVSTLILLASINAQAKTPRHNPCKLFSGSMSEGALMVCKVSRECCVFQCDGAKADRIRFGGSKETRDLVHQQCRKHCETRCRPMREWE